MSNQVTVGSPARDARVQALSDVLLVTFRARDPCLLRIRSVASQSLTSCLRSPSSSSGVVART